MDPTKLVTDTYNQIADIYTDRYFDISSDIPLIDRLLNLLPEQAKVLDLGCGPGNFTQYLLSKGFVTEGIDISEVMLTIAKQHLPQVPFVQGNMSELPYTDVSFDAVLSAYSLIHIPQADIPKTLMGIKRVLKKNGLILVLAQSGSSDHMIAEPLQPKLQNFVNFFSLEQLAKAFQEQGFKIKEHIEIPIDDPDNLTDSLLFLIAQKTD